VLKNPKSCGCVGLRTLHNTEDAIEWLRLNVQELENRLDAAERQMVSDDRWAPKPTYASQIPWDWNLLTSGDFTRRGAQDQGSDISALLDSLRGRMEPTDRAKSEDPLL
jgi:hypothetical protein